MKNVTMLDGLRLAQQLGQCVELRTRSKQHFGPSEVLELDADGGWVRLSPQHALDDARISPRIAIADIESVVVHNDD